MSGFKLNILALVGMILATLAAEKACAQIYGGIYYGPGRHHSSFYAGTYFPGSYGAGAYYGSPFGYVGGYGNGFGTNGTAYPYGLGYPYGTAYSYSTGNVYSTGNAYATGNAVSTYNSSGTAYYGVGNLGYGATYGQPGYGYTSPAVVSPSPAYGTSTTIIRNGPTGGVMQYNAKGDGYTYVPDSTYPTVIQNQPTLGLSRTFVPPSPNPVVVESRPQGTSYGLNSPRSQPASGSAPTSSPMIKLALPRTASGPLTYTLNGHLYTIQPGYSQTFRDDRAWTIEFTPGGDSSAVIRQPLKAGTYTFASGATGWELRQTGIVPGSDVPPAPLPSPLISPQPPGAPALLPNLTPPLNDSSIPPTPLPPP